MWPAPFDGEKDLSVQEKWCESLKINPQRNAVLIGRPISGGALAHLLVGIDFFKGRQTYNYYKHDEHDGKVERKQKNLKYTLN